MHRAHLRNLLVRLLGLRCQLSYGMTESVSAFTRKEGPTMLLSDVLTRTRVCVTQDKEWRSVSAARSSQSDRVMEVEGLLDLGYLAMIVCVGSNATNYLVCTYLGICYLRTEMTGIRFTPHCPSVKYKYSHHTLTTFRTSKCGKDKNSSLWTLLSNPCWLLL